MVSDMEVSHPVAGNRCVIAHIRQLVREEFDLSASGPASGIGADPLEGKSELFLRLKALLRPFIGQIEGHGSRGSDEASELPVSRFPENGGLIRRR